MHSDPSPTPGVFVSLEGGDHAGKTTQLVALAAWLGGATGREVVVTREPGGTEVGRRVRELLLHGGALEPRTEALLYAADRAEHVAVVVRPALARGAVVLTDRYLDSSVAYQAAGRALPASQVENLSRWATGGLLPDLTVLLDLSPQAARARREGPPDRIEAEGGGFHERVREAFLARAAAEPGRWVVIDADGSVEQVAARVRDAVADRLGGRLGSPAGRRATPGGEADDAS